MGTEKVPKTDLRDAENISKDLYYFGNTDANII